MAQDETALRLSYLGAGQFGNSVFRDGDDPLIHLVEPREWRCRSDSSFEEY